MNSLILFTCPKCQKEIAWAKETATVYCKKCDCWINNHQLKASTQQKMDAKTGQLLLF